MPICTSMISTRHLARVFEPVPLRGDDVDALVLTHELLLPADHDLGRAVHDDPMLGAVMVHLHGKFAAGLDVQQLDLEARPDVQRLEVAPGPIVAEVLLLLLAVRLLQACDDRRNFLRPVLVGNEERIGRIDNDRGF